LLGDPRREEYRKNWPESGPAGPETDCICRLRRPSRLAELYHRAEPTAADRGFAEDALKRLTRLAAARRRWATISPSFRSICCRVAVRRSGSRTQGHCLVIPSWLGSARVRRAHFQRTGTLTLSELILYSRVPSHTLPLQALEVPEHDETQPLFIFGHYCKAHEGDDRWRQHDFRNDRLSKFYLRAESSDATEPLLCMPPYY